MNKNAIKENVPVLKVKDLNKTYKTKKGYNKVVNRVSFELQPGKILGLIGESGSGKTTTGRTLIRLVEDFSGLVQIENEVVSGDKLDKKSADVLRKSMQMIFQNPYSSINPLFNVYSVLSEALKASGLLKYDIDDIKKDYADVNSHFELDLKLNVLAVRNEFNERMIEYVNKKFMKFRKETFVEDIRNTMSPTQAFNKMVYEWNLLVGNVFQVQNNLIEELKVKLLDFYHSKKEIYRSDKVSQVEIDLEKAKKELTEATPKAKYSKEYNDAYSVYTAAQSAFETKKSEIVHILKLSKQTLKSLYTEYTNDDKRYAEAMKESKTNVDYNFFWVKTLIVKGIMKAIDEAKLKSFYFLSFDDIGALKDELDDVKEQVITIFEKEKRDVIISDDPIKKNLYKQLVSKSAFLVISRFLKKAIVTKTALEEEFYKLKDEMDKKKAEVPNKKIASASPEIPYDEYESIRERHHNAVTAFIEVVQDGRTKVHNAIKEMTNKLNISSNDYKNLFDISVLGFNELFIKLGNEIVDRINNQYKEYNELSKQCLANSFIDLPDTRMGRLLKEQIASGTFNEEQRKSTLKEWKMKATLESQNISRNNSRLEAMQIDYKSLQKDIEIISNFMSAHGWRAVNGVEKILEKERVYKALDEVGLPRDFAYRYSFEMSGGQLQRVAIARALISQPKIIIADEPIASLDISIQAQIVNLLREIAVKKGISIIFVAHDLSMVEHISDEILILHRGKVVECGDTKKIFSNPIHPYTQILFNSISTIENANKPFEKVEAQYSPEIEPTYAERAMYYQVAPSHVVFGIEKQVNKWTDNKQVKKLGDYVLEGKAFEFDETKAKIDSSLIEENIKQIKAMKLEESANENMLSTLVNDTLKEFGNLLTSKLQALV